MYIGRSSQTLENLWEKTNSQRVYGDFVRDVLKELNRYIMPLEFNSINNI